MSDRPSLTLKRHLRARPGIVWRAWTDPERIMLWWGTAGASTLLAETDLRVGGRFRIAFRTPDGERHEVGGAYLDVVPDERLVFSWAWHTTPERESRVTIALEPDGAGTLLTLTHEMFADGKARDDHRKGWGEALDRIEELLTSPASSPQPRLERQGPRALAGPSRRHDMANRGDIAAQWQGFVAQAGRRADGVVYGACFDMAEDDFSYLCGIADGGPVAEGWRRLPLGEAEWAVFAHDGGIERLPATLHAIYGTWLPASGRTPAPAIDGCDGFLERYGEGFDPARGEGDIEIWLPLRPSSGGEAP